MEFQIGDRVEYIGKNTYALIGKQGTVVGVSSSSGFLVTVVWDDVPLRSRCHTTNINNIIKIEFLCNADIDVSEYL